MPTAITVVLAIAGFAAVFAVFWTAVTFLVSLGGWRRLARLYRTDARRVPGERFSFISGKLGWATYSTALNVTIGAEGLHLSVMVLFALSHPPLQIPWDDVHEDFGTGLLSLVGREFRLGRTPGVRLVVFPMHVAEAIREALAASRT